MSNSLLVRKIVEKLAKEVQDWNVKSSNMHGSDADWYIGFKGADTANENEYDSKTNNIDKNDTISNHLSYLQQWDADNTGYIEEEERDNGGGIARIVMQQVTPIK